MIDSTAPLTSTTCPSSLPPLQIVPGAHVRVPTGASRCCGEQGRSPQRLRGVSTRSLSPVRPPGAAVHLQHIQDQHGEMQRTRSTSALYDSYATIGCSRAPVLVSLLKIAQFSAQGRCSHLAAKSGPDWLKTSRSWRISSPCVGVPCHAVCERSVPCLVQSCAEHHAPCSCGGMALWGWHNTSWNVF